MPGKNDGVCNGWSRSFGCTASIATCSPTSVNISVKAPYNLGSLGATVGILTSSEILWATCHRRRAHHARTASVVSKSGDPHAQCPWNPSALSCRSRNARCSTWHPLYRPYSDFLAPSETFWWITPTNLLQDAVGLLVTRPDFTFFVSDVLPQCLSSLGAWLSYARVVTLLPISPRQPAKSLSPYTSNRRGVPGRSLLTYATFSRHYDDFYDRFSIRRMSRIGLRK